MDAAPEYDARYLVGIDHFNRGEYFDAHEVWEDLWRDCDPADRLFYQSLIQAAVALYHWSRGNRIGSQRLFVSGREKMIGYRPVHLGVEVDHFWQQVELTLTDAPTDHPTSTATRPRIELPRHEPDHD